MAWQLQGTYFENCSCDMVCPCDAAVSPEEAEKLGAVFGGQAGGPMAMLSPLIGESLGMQNAPIDYVSNGQIHSVKVGELMDIEIEDFVAPGNSSGEVEHLTGMFHSANTRLSVAKANRSRVEAFGLRFANEGKNGHSAPFSWAS